MLSTLRRGKDKQLEWGNLGRAASEFGVNNGSSQ
uniref:Ankyrin repeat family protein n=1 Tax=Rhizophora mucronata TaxID=61149 RepID=A0A2P2N8X0_RHIMU